MWCSSPSTCSGAVVQWCSGAVVQWYSGQWYIVQQPLTCSSPQLTVRLREVCGAREDLEDRETEDSLENMGTEKSLEMRGTGEPLEERGTGEPLEGRGTEEDISVTGTVLVGHSESMLSTLGLVSRVVHNH